jgi:F-type H+-transporting ATPase subunit epsilon
MRLRITTPLEIVLDLADVTALRAEDASGGFGVLPGHADFLTSLSVGVVSWTTKTGARQFCATRRGAFSVEGGEHVSIATREAVLGGDLATLHDTVLARFHADIEAERAERVGGAQLELSAIRQIVTRLRGGARRI